MAEVRENDMTSVNEKLRAELDKAWSEPPRTGLQMFLVPALAAAALMGATAVIVKYVF